MAGLSEKQRQAMRERAAREAAAKEPSRGTGRRAPRPPVVLTVVLCALLAAGGAMAAWSWHAASPEPVRAYVPEDAGTSVERGGYFPDTGLPSQEDEITENPAAAGNVGPEDVLDDASQAAPMDGPAQDAMGSAPGALIGFDDGTDGEAAGPAPPEGPGGVGAGPDTVPEDAERVLLPAYMAGMGQDEASGYAAGKGWYGAEAGEDGSVAFFMSAEMLEAERAVKLAELEAAMAAAPDAGVLSLVEAADESGGAFRAYVAGGHEEDAAGWKASAGPVLAKAAELAVFRGSNNPSVMMSMCSVDESGAEVPLDTLWYVNGEVV